jgi:hypothetical protein
MKRPTRQTPILVCALLGVMVAGQATAVDLRYQADGDWTNTVAVDLTYGWQGGGSGPGGLPGEADTARLNWGGMAGNTVTLSTVAPLIKNFQFGVNESGYLIVNAGGVLTAGVGANNSSVGNNNLGCIGRMTVNTGGQVIVTNVLFVGNGTHGFVTNDGGNIRVTSHLWVGAATGINGEVWITNGGVMNIGGNIGLGTKDGTLPSGGTGKVYVNNGGILNLTTINSGTSIQTGSVLDISGSGVVVINSDRVSRISAYTNAAKITAYGGAGTVGIDYNNTNVGKTTLWAIAPPAPPPTNCIWIATSGAGTWNQGANWDSGVAPLSITKANFNLPGAISCTVTSSAVADYVVMGENGPGGTLNIASGGSLVCGGGGTNVIGLNSNALMVVENGGSATFAAQLRIGLDPDSDGTLVMNGGTVSVSGMFDLGGNGGKGTAQIKGGTLNLAQFADYASMGAAALLDITGTGKVVINGDHKFAMDGYVTITGQVTNSSGAGLVVDYNIINVGKTTIYPADLYLPPAQVTWAPMDNPSTTGLWDECANWRGGGGLCPGSVTYVLFETPDAIPCTVTNAAFAGVVRMGISGPGGTLIITNGGSLVCATLDWNAVAYHSNALMIVEDGGSASFAYHLWVGFNPDADGTLIMNGGTVSVGGAFGLGFSGGKGTAQIHGGTLNLAQWNDTQAIQGASLLDIAGTGTVLMTGNHLNSVSNYISAGKITANGGAGTVAYGYDSSLNQTILQVAPPQPSITGVAVSGGNATITCQTTPGHFYAVQSSTNVSPTAWTRVAGTTTNATGASVTLTFPVSGDQRFYRTVSP